MKSDNNVSVLLCTPKFIRFSAKGKRKSIWNKPTPTTTFYSYNLHFVWGKNLKQCWHEIQGWCPEVLSSWLITTVLLQIYSLKFKPKQVKPGIYAKNVEKTAKESPFWKEKWPQGICQEELLQSKCLVIPVVDHQTQILHEGLQTLKTGPLITKCYWWRVIAQ